MWVGGGWGGGGGGGGAMFMAYGCREKILFVTIHVGRGIFCAKYFSKLALNMIYRQRHIPWDTRMNGNKKVT